MTTEKEMIEELNCDELCFLESRKKPLQKSTKNAIREKRQETGCSCTIF